MRALQASEEVEDLELMRRVERARRLVADEECRLEQECHRDRRALPHAARELVRPGVEARFGLGDPDLVERGGDRRRASPEVARPW